MYSITSILVLLASASQLVSGHGAIIKAVGDAGGEGMALGGTLLHLHSSHEYHGLLFQLILPLLVTVRDVLHSSKTLRDSEMLARMLVARLSVVEKTTQQLKFLL